MNSRLSEENAFVLQSLYILSVFLTAAVLFLTHLSDILGLLVNGDKQAAVSLTSALSQGISNNLQRIDSIPFASMVVVAGFWMLVGLLVYFCIISTISFISTLRAEEKIVKTYVLPVFATRQSLIARILLNWTVLAFIALLGIFFVLLAIGTGIPLINQLFISGLYGNGVLRWALLSSAPLLGGCILTIIAILYRLLLSAARPVFLR